MQPDQGSQIDGQRSRSAIWAGRLGFASILLFPAPFAVAIGFWAVLDLHRRRGLSGWRSAITGLVLGGLGCVALALLNPGTSADLAFFALCVGLAASAVAWIHGCIVAADERPMWGALAALIPLFWLWYCASRWRRCWPHLTMVLLGYPLFLLGAFSL